MKLLNKRLQLVAFIIVALMIALSQILPGYLSASQDIISLNEKQFIAHIDRQIPKLMKSYSIPGSSILIIRDGKELWSNTYGYADEEQQRPLTTESIIMAHSISKSVTAWGVMKLVQKGKIRLDDPVSDYINSWEFPASDFPEQEVTIRRLLSNSAGVPLGTFGAHYSTADGVPPLTESLSGDDVRLIREPGSSFIYSNSGFAVLELLIQEVTGRDFATYMEEEILLPLGMNNSGYNLTESMLPKIPRGYDLNGRSIRAYLYPYRASGGLFSTLGDLGRFAVAGMALHDANPGHSVLSPESVAGLYIPQISVPGMFGVVTDSYGFGHFIEQLPDKGIAVWHGGQGLGWMTHFHSVPERGAGIVILTNSQRSWPFMAHVLNDWSRWSGFGPVKFSRIVPAVSGFRIIVGLILLISLWRAGQIISEIKAGKRKLTFLNSNASNTQIFELSVWVIVTASLLWATKQDYLFISSIFPVGAVWLGWTLLFLSLVLLVSVLLPVDRTTEIFNSNR